MESIVLKDIPTNVRVPGVYFEVDSSRANQSLPGMPRRILVIGDKTPAGTELAGVPKRILDAAQGPALYGYGSPIARMLSEVRKHNSNTELWAMVGGTAAATLPTVRMTLTLEGPGYGIAQRGLAWTWGITFDKNGVLNYDAVTVSYACPGVGDADLADLEAAASALAASWNSQYSGGDIVASSAGPVLTFTANTLAAIGNWSLLPSEGNPNAPGIDVPDGNPFSSGEGGSGASALGAINLTVSNPSAGTLHLYVAGRHLPVNVLTTDTDATLAARIAIAVNADVHLPVGAGNVGGSVSLPAKWDGISGNDCDLRLNYYPDEQTPNGVTVSFTPVSGGVGGPDMLALLAALGDEPFTAIVTPWTDSSTLATVENWLEERYGPMDPKPGHIWAADRSALAGLVNAGTNRNSQFSTILGTYGVPEPAYLWAASAAALCEYEATIDPARPLQQLELKRLAPALSQRMTRSERETLLNSGIATFTVSADGSVFTERMITTYQVNNLDAADVTWLDLETVNTVDAIRYAVRYRIASKFPRMKLADNGTQFAPGQPIVTPSVIRAELVSLFREMEAAGWVENFEQFKSDLQVVRSSSDRNRVNVIFPPDLVNQLRVVAGSIQFRL